MNRRARIGLGLGLGLAGLMAACGGGAGTTPRPARVAADAADAAVAAGEAQVGALAGVPGTGSAAAAPVPKEGDLLVFQIAAGRDLNTFNRQAHTLVLVLYQLSQSTVFGQLAETPEGRMKLLEGEAFDPSVLARRRVVVQPGESQSLVMDRIEGSRYAAAIGGFYNASGPGAARVFPVALKQTGMLLWKKPAPQVIELGLGANGFTP